MLSSPWNRSPFELIFRKQEEVQYDVYISFSLDSFRFFPDYIHTHTHDILTTTPIFSFNYFIFPFSQATKKLQPYVDIDRLKSWRFGLEITPRMNKGEYTYRYNWPWMTTGSISCESQHAVLFYVDIYYMHAPEWTKAAAPAAGTGRQIKHVILSCRLISSVGID